jgi:hypothetical protein
MPQWTYEQEQLGRAEIRIDTPLVQCELDVGTIGLEETVMEAGGLDRRLHIYRLPDQLSTTAVSVTESVELNPKKDNPLYAKVVQEDGHAAWSSPIYLVPG